MNVRVFYNARAGPAGPGPGDLVATLRSLGIESAMIPLDDATLVNEVCRAKADRIDAVIAAGGDGTVSALAGALVATGGDSMPMGILPTGTLNHFAKDIGLPLKVADAAKVIALNKPTPVDVGEVNNRTFVNNASIGLYPHMVSKRDRHRQRLGYGKWLAMFVAFLSVFRRYPVLEVDLAAGDASVRRTTPFVFVGNNWYEFAAFNLGGRGCMQNGVLSLYTANRTGRLGLVVLAVRALFGRLDQARDFDALRLRSFTVDTPKKTLRIALDGEVTRMTPPLRFLSRPAALRVLAP
jgi:diacylglycerol kinase family enzyme